MSLGRRRVERHGAGSDVRLVAELAEDAPGLRAFGAAGPVVHQALESFEGKLADGRCPVLLGGRATNLVGVRQGGPETLDEVVRRLGHLSSPSRQDRRSASPR